MQATSHNEQTTMSEQESLHSVGPSFPEGDQRDTASNWTEDTSTSSATERFDDTFDHETLQSLEWPKITAYLASLCRTEWGHHMAMHLPFAATRPEAERELKQAAEAHSLWMTLGEELPVAKVKDLRNAFRRLEKGGSLDGPTFLELGHFLHTVASVRSFLYQYREELPTCWERGELLESCKGLHREIESTIDRNGSLKEDASWELGALRQHVRKCHEGIRRKMQDYLSSPTSRYLTDTYYTIREDRYVLPVKASEQSQIPGIVFGSSSSGMTVFVEPRELVERNNALRIAETDVSIEEARILRKLSTRAAKVVPVLMANLELLRDLDLVAARVKMAISLEATMPVLAPADGTAHIALKRARHPLLLLKGIDVVANDLELGPERRSLLISGPNTGGKTVALKTMGICALMARAALPIPADEGSVVPFFDAVFTDIGDRQSLEHDLSTFSAQILKLRSIMEMANDSTLVLIDEIVVGTDPEQGHALAAAILEDLASKHSFVAVTTHYPQLKAMPHEDERFANACVGFNLETLEPTYRVFLGAPGGSSALSIARRLGLSESLCQRAESLLTPEADRFERVVSRLEQQYEELYAERERSSKARRLLERERLALREQQEELEKLKERVVINEELEWRNAIREARKVIRELTQELKESTTPDWQRVRKAEKRLHETEEQARQIFAEAQPAPVVEQPQQKLSLSVGQKVYVRSLRTNGEVVELPDGSGQVLLRIGTLRTRVSMDDIQSKRGGKGNQKQGARGKQAKKGKHTHAPQFRVTQEPAPAPARMAQTSENESFGGLPTSYNQCDLRGMRVDEAIEKVEAFLDQAFQKELDVIYLIHGHGTGALRSAVREFCRSSSYVLRFRAGEPPEGGNGVTAVMLV
jgi:DNA mismatch repair protein MutS2